MNNETTEFHIRLLQYIESVSDSCLMLNTRLTTVEEKLKTIEGDLKIAADAKEFRRRYKNDR
jgi:hypothetical protein